MKRAILILLLVLGAAAHADTGGSMGGGDWSDSGGGGNSSDDGWSSSSSTGDVRGDVGAKLVVLIFLLFVWAIIAAAKGGDPAATSVPDPVDVSVLRIAVDGRARKFVQAELKKIAAGIDTSSREGRGAMLRQVALLLRRLKDAWVYGGAVNEPMRQLGDSKPVFDRYVDDARSRFREETVRNEQGQKTATAASSYTPRSDEGAGLILVSVIIAARRELFTVNRIGNGDDLRQALDAASQLMPASLVAIEIVWQPSEDADRLSSMELEAKYPRPELLPIDGALVGKVFCAYCAGPFPAELVSCPHCGAPAPGRAPQKQAA